MIKCDFCPYSRMIERKLQCPYKVCMIGKDDIIEILKNLKPQKEDVKNKVYTSLYWVSAIILDKSDNKPRLVAMGQGEVKLDKAMEIVNRLKENEVVLSVWIDTYDDKGVKNTIYHDCYINAFGDIKQD